MEHVDCEAMNRQAAGREAARTSITMIYEGQEGCLPKATTYLRSGLGGSRKEALVELRIFAISLESGARYER